MGADIKKAPPLPAPTETDTNTPTELTTDLSKLGDEKSSYSIPDDGTPVTIPTRGRKSDKSPTSLLIEYFEGSRKSASGSQPGSASRNPSLRVRLTPSRKSRGHHIRLTETGGSRKPSITRRIPLDDVIASREGPLHEGDDGHSSTSYASATEESNVSRNPIEVEVNPGRHRRRRPASPLIPAAGSYQPGNPSEISAIPTDSFLDGSGPAANDSQPPGYHSHGEELAAAAGTAALAGAAMEELEQSKARRAGKERVRVHDTGLDKSERKRHPKGRSASGSEQAREEGWTPRRRPGRSIHGSNVSGADSSLLSSNMSPSHRSLEAYSNRSGSSKASINNPKLLEMVEDTICRLILPELSAIKRERSQRDGRHGSPTSTATSASRDDVSVDRRRSSGHRRDSARENPRRWERRDREARHNYDDEYVHSPSQDSLGPDGPSYEDEASAPRHGDGMLRMAAAGAAGATAAKGLSDLMDERSSEDTRHRERRRRRTESARSRSLGGDRLTEDYDDDHLAVPAPPMPLMSDINPSDMTRTSILSAETDGEHSAGEFATLPNAERGVASPNNLTPTRSETHVDFQHGLGTMYNNVSHGDLTALPRGRTEMLEGYEADELGRKVPLETHEYDEESYPRGIHEPADYPDESYDEGYYNTQDVPPPLKYVPYQAGARGLSPIPSVSGYTEAGSEAPPRNSRSLHSVSEALPSPDKSPHHIPRSHSAHSWSSIPSNTRSREFNDTLSAEERSLRSADGDQRIAGGHHGRLEQRLPGQQPVLGLGASPDFVHPHSGAESAVASLVDGSLLEQSELTGISGGPLDSTLAQPEEAQAVESCASSPEKRSVDSRRDVYDDRRGTPGSTSLDPSQDVSEYEIDEHGRKVPRSRYRHSPTASEAAITAGAVGAAAAALKRAQERKQAYAEEPIDEEFQPAGVFRNKSFKERAMEGWEPRSTPAHSIDRLEYDDHPKMGATGLPDLHNPMPEADYVSQDMRSTPSVVEGRLDGVERDASRDSGNATPTPREADVYERERDLDHDAPAKSHGLGIAEAAGVAALGAAAGMAAAGHSRDNNGQAQDDWRRTSDERKRDTLVTNPYEDSSPIVNPALDENLLGARGLNPSYNAPYQTGSPGFGPKYDEGYISNGPHGTPDIEPTGKAVGFSGAEGTRGLEDPFYQPKDARHLSGMSQGMASPFYDAATGAGIERIENKDIVALMQHLMVRDAQRSARDTELVSLLMNSAIEMRNSFREIKDMVQDTSDDVIFANVENTEKLHKAINGPRPYPGAGSRSIQSASQAETLNSAAKKKNLWRRALEGLGARGASDLSRIEDMLMQLLGEVDVLKTQTVAQAPASGAGRSADNLRPEGQYENDKGYEPEGDSTASHASPAGHHDIQQGRSDADERDLPGQRVGAVAEDDEEYSYDHPGLAKERGMHDRLTPGGDLASRGGSVPLDTPPRATAALHVQTLSAENTPRTERGKKHKSSSSSGWIPKISRWSETTASSVGKAFRGSSKRESKYDENLLPSRSGSSLASYNEADRHDPYGEDKLHTGLSDSNLQETNTNATGPAGPSFLAPEDPKYRAHRNSLNLQHPQPRPGPSQRFQTALETSAQDYHDPATPRSADWAGSATSVNRLPQNTQRYSNSSSAAAREGDYWSPGAAQTGPPRPPKDPLEEAAGRTPTKTGRGPNAYPGSPRIENRNLSGVLGVPARKPSGPRAMTPKSAEDEAAREERRRKRGQDTFGTADSQDTETF